MADPRTIVRNAGVSWPAVDKLQDSTEQRDHWMVRPLPLVGSCHPDLVVLLLGSNPKCERLEAVDSFAAHQHLRQRHAGSNLRRHISSFHHAPKILDICGEVELFPQGGISHEYRYFLDNFPIISRGRVLPEIIASARWPVLAWRLNWSAPS